MRKLSRRFLLLFVIMVWPLVVQAGLPEGYDRIFLDPKASPAVRKSAETLADLLFRTFGEHPEIRREPLFLKPVGIHIGPRPDDPAFDTDPLTDEILISVSARGLEIRGSDNSSTSFAVFKFAEVFLGWRYFQPGEIGLERLDNPSPPPVLSGAPKQLFLSRADFLSRNPQSRFSTPDNLPDWGQWNGLRERFAYNHTLQGVLPPTRFDTHPEWFAKDSKGQPIRPPYYPKVHGYNDHPDLSQADVRQWVSHQTIKAISQATPFNFGGRESASGDKIYARTRQSPGALSVSLSLGDSYVFGEFEQEYPWRPQGYFRRWPDWSNHVFAYTNAVADHIFDAWQKGQWDGPEKPDLFLGALAYLNWENVPDFPLNPRIVPYLTFDRSQWYDPKAREDDLENVARWNTTEVPFLGTWDYLFGYGFIIPRSMSQIVAGSVPALHDRGVRAYFCQVAAIWPFDGHTTWLLTRLLWDKDAPAEALLDEYFSEFYGPAAIPMRRFFDKSESIWMNQEGSGWWLRYWKDPSQIALYDLSDLLSMQADLDNAVKLARRLTTLQTGDALRPERFSNRIKQTELIFSLTKALYFYQTALWSVQTSEPGETRLSEFERVMETRDLLLKARDEIARNGINADHATDLDWVFRYGGFGAALADFIKSAPLDTDDQVREKASELLQRWSTLRGFDGIPALPVKPEPVLYDTRFSHYTDRRIWHRQLMDSPDARIASGDHSGLVAESVRRGHVYQLFTAVPGDFYQGEIALETHQSVSGQIFIRLDFFDGDHKLLTESPRARIAPTEKYGQRQRLRMLTQAPPNAAYGRILIRFYEMDPGSRAQVHEVTVDRLRPQTPP